MRRTIQFLFENSMFLVAGAIGGLLWANLDHDSYEHLVHAPLLETTRIGYAHHLALFYPQEEVKLIWMLLPVTAILLGVLFRRLEVYSFWPYLIGPGTLSWVGFALAGLHPALGLLPIIPTLPHARVDTGLFNWVQRERQDTLTAFEHWWRRPVELILGVFGFLNAGLVINTMASPTYLVLAGLLVGKPLGIWVGGMFAARVLRFGLPRGMDSRALFVVGCLAGIGFTVSLFIATVAFPPGYVQDAAKMGALASFAAAVLSVVAAKIMKIGRTAAVVSGEQRVP